MRVNTRSRSRRCSPSRRDSGGGEGWRWSGGGLESSYSWYYSGFHLGGRGVTSADEAVHYLWHPLAGGGSRPQRGCFFTGRPHRSTP